MSSCGRVLVRHIAPVDAPAWEAVRRDLWPEGRDEHAAEIAMFFAGTQEEPVAVLVAENAAGSIVGIAELSVRTGVASLAGERTGYVEGLYVSPEVRGQGVAQELLQASRKWARQQGCTAFASDRADRIVIDRSFGRTQTHAAVRLH